MSKIKVQCPVCGGADIARRKTIGSANLVMGSEFSFEKICYKCNSCGEEGDFTGEADRNFLASKKQAQINLVQSILSDMYEVGISMAMFERVFELPSRTLTRWKSGDFSATGIALLRLVATYPWLIGVAEHKFEPVYARVSVIKIAAEYLEEPTTPVVTYTSIPREDSLLGSNQFTYDMKSVESGA